MKNKLLRIGKKALIVVAVIWFVLVLIGAGRKWYFDKTDSQIARIHNTKLSIDDVMGKNLPPDPGIEADKTIEGIDANKNGIRDDVELAIFKEYPNSAKTRMPLLQYALSMQLQMTLSFINKDTVTATVEDTDSRANVCIWTLSKRPDMSTIKSEDDDNPNSPLKKFIRDIDNYENFVKNLQLNTQQRKDYLYNLYEDNLKSFGLSNEGCDIDPSTLLN